MRGKTYVYFNGKTEYIGTGGEEQTAYPLGSLVFGTLDVDWEPYLEQARALRRAYTGVDFGETCTMPQRLSEPETCVYYQVAEFYHNMSLSVKTVSPAFFDLLEGYCLAVWRAYDQESEPYLEALASGVNDTGLSDPRYTRGSSTWETRRSPETLWKATAGAFRHTPSR